MQRATSECVAIICSGRGKAGEVKKKLMIQRFQDEAISVRLFFATDADGFIKIYSYRGKNKDNDH